MKIFAPIFLLIFTFSLTAKESLRTWTSVDGRSIEARYLEMVGDKVQIENASGRKFTVPLTGFSPADQDYVKKAYERSLFFEPQPFEDEGRGGVIITSAKGKVEVLVEKTDRYIDPKPRNVIVGESIASGSTLSTGKGAEADLLLTNGTLVHMSQNTKLVLNAIYQKVFKGTKLKASQLEREASPSRTDLKLLQGDMVLEVRKLGKESSFLVSTAVAQMGIRGTQFKVSVRADSAELSVLEGRVDFLDSVKEQTSVEGFQKVGSMEGDPSKLGKLSASEQEEVKNKVGQSKQASASIDLNRMANTVDGYSQRPTFTVRSIGLEMIWCKPGSFVMGPDEKRQDSPAHPVILTEGFYLGKYEVTQEQYQKVTGNNPSRFKGDNFPVEMVSWNDAVEFCEILSKRENRRGWKFSLPTEAQWEYACRAGTTTTYSWGNTISPNHANYPESKLKKTQETGSYSPNSWGFYDMHGNVAEWCNDYFGPYSQDLSLDPQGPVSAPDFVRRGGSWFAQLRYVKAAGRIGGKPDRKERYIGFRVAFSQIE
jgi:formylglycine-generating enzyme required for sulfatase activity